MSVSEKRRRRAVCGECVEGGNVVGEGSMCEWGECRQISARIRRIGPKGRGLDKGRGRFISIIIISTGDIWI